ncbi:SdpI family protein [Myroides indicus]|uniref:SdpI/YhfL family protein n=1 Tax=Myroides indicus TaxID=1323422 RepID=A0A4R7F463_9FLAO|nr:SdpI family protein [Myroides indicus]TDS60202.1 SdpI/YhfL family protein [Myroides indicus]
MNPEDSISVILFFVAFITLISGYLFRFKPPKTINFIYGYRTKRSMSGQEHWDFAHLYSGKLMLILGAVLFFLALLSLFVKIQLEEPFLGLLAVGIFVIGMAIVIYKTEKALKKTFDNKKA